MDASLLYTSCDCILSPYVSIEPLNSSFNSRFYSFLEAFVWLESKYTRRHVHKYNRDNQLPERKSLPFHFCASYVPIACLGTV
jgi:hypothetical protein